MAASKPIVNPSTNANPIGENLAVNNVVQRASDVNLRTDLETVGNLLSSQHNNVSSLLKAVDKDTATEYSEVLGELHGVTLLNLRRVAAEVGMTFSGNQHNYTSQTKGEFALAITNNATTYIRNEAPIQISKSRDYTQVVDNTLHTIANFCSGQYGTRVIQVAGKDISFVGESRIEYTLTDERSIVKGSRYHLTSNDVKEQVKGDISRLYEGNEDVIISGDSNTVVSGNVVNIIEGTTENKYISDHSSKYEGIKTEEVFSSSTYSEAGFTVRAQVRVAIGAPTTFIGNYGDIVYLGMGTVTYEGLDVETPEIELLDLKTYDEDAKLILGKEAAAVEGTANNAIGSYNAHPTTRLVTGLVSDPLKPKGETTGTAGLWAGGGPDEYNKVDNSGASNA